MSHKKNKFEDSKTSKHIRSEFTKHMLEVQNAEFRVMHDVCYVTGSIGIQRGGPADPREHAEKIKELVIAKRYVKDMVFQCTWRTS